MVEQLHYRVACCPAFCKQFLDRPIRYRVSALGSNPRLFVLQVVQPAAAVPVAAGAAPLTGARVRIPLPVRGLRSRSCRGGSTAQVTTPSRGIRGASATSARYILTCLAHSRCRPTCLVPAAAPARNAAHGAASATCGASLRIRPCGASKVVCDPFTDATRGAGQAYAELSSEIV